MDQLEDLSRRQRGVISRTQAIEAGLTVDTVRSRLRSGRWRRLHTGVYATFPGEVSRAAWRWAAVLRAGRGAVLAGRAAAEEVGLAEEDSGAIHVVIPAGRRMVQVPGLVIRRCAHAAERRHPTRMPPQTRVEETVLDLAAEAADATEATAWVAEACGRRLTTPRQVARALRRREQVTRRNELRLLVGDVLSGTDSLLGWRYLRDVERAHSLPVGLRPTPDDVRYPDQGVRVRLGGRSAGPAESATVAVLRYAFAEVTERPCEVAREVAAELWRAGRWAGGRRCGPGCRFVAAVSA